MCFQPFIFPHNFCVELNYYIWFNAKNCTTRDYLLQITSISSFIFLCVKDCLFGVFLTEIPILFL